jgi:hypothetical protein
LNFSSRLNTAPISAASGKNPIKNNITRIWKVDIILNLFVRVDLLFNYNIYYQSVSISPELKHF